MTMSLERLETNMKTLFEKMNEMVDALNALDERISALEGGKPVIPYAPPPPQEKPKKVLPKQVSLSKIVAKQ